MKKENKQRQNGNRSKSLLRKRLIPSSLININKYYSQLIASTGQSSAACWQASSASLGTTSTLTTATSSCNSKTSGHVLSQSPHPVQRS